MSFEKPGFLSPGFLILMTSYVNILITESM